jgi:hypothetical protein
VTKTQVIPPRFEFAKVHKNQYLPKKSVKRPASLIRLDAA